MKTKNRIRRMPSDMVRELREHYAAKRKEWDELEIDEVKVAAFEWAQEREKREKGKKFIFRGKADKVLGAWKERRMEERRRQQMAALKMGKKPKDNLKGWMDLALERWRKKLIMTRVKEREAQLHREFTLEDATTTR